MLQFISLLLVFSILALSGNLFAKEKRGADLIIQKKDGQHVRGELIAVKKNSLLLLDRESGADVTDLTPSDRSIFEGLLVRKIIYKSEYFKRYDSSINKEQKLRERLK